MQDELNFEFHLAREKPPTLVGVQFTINRSYILIGVYLNGNGINLTIKNNIENNTINISFDSLKAFQQAFKLKPVDNTIMPIIQTIQLAHQLRDKFEHCQTSAFIK